MAGTARYFYFKLEVRLQPYSYILLTLNLKYATLFVEIARSRAIGVRGNINCLSDDEDEQRPISENGGRICIKQLQLLRGGKYSEVSAHLFRCNDEEPHARVLLLTNLSLWTKSVQARKAGLIQPGTVTLYVR